MKFVHIADMHFDAPFSVLSHKGNFGDKRRIAQRNIFKKIIEFIKENDIEFFFISGDLWEHESIRKSSVEYIHKLFEEIPNTKIYISPGNHDPYLHDSYYQTFPWGKNVKIFGGTVEKVELPTIDIYGFGFENFYCEEHQVEELEINNPNKINILITHGSLEGGYDEEKVYHTMKKSILKQKGFDYIALGHIHKTNYPDENNIIYPGSPLAMGFDELGQHGMVVGEIINKKVNLAFIPLEEETFIEKNVDVTEIKSKEELLEQMEAMGEGKFIKVILTGDRNFEINPKELLGLLENSYIIKIKNKTTFPIDYEKLVEEASLRGIFVKECLAKIEKAESIEKKEKIKTALEIGLDCM